MNPETFQTTRRDFLRTSTKAVAGAALAAAVARPGYAAENNTIQVALIGCGGRGTGAADNALSTKSGPIKLVAMADVFENKLNRSLDSLEKKHTPAGKFDVPEERRFLGFDSAKKAMDCLKKGDIAIFATPPAFRWPFLEYAIEKGLNVFMEKPVTVDGPTTRKMFELADAAEKKSLKVGVGLMIRHCKGRQELHQRIADGQIGDLMLMRAYRTGGPAATAGRRSPEMNETLYQISRFHAFLWASGGVFSDYNIHQIDECSWMKNAWPVRAHAVGGRHFRGDSFDQNFDSYSIEYTYPDGTKLWFTGRHMGGCHNEFASYVHGTKGSGIVSTNSHSPGRVRLFKNQNIGNDSMIWAFPQPEPSPYQLEWDDLVDAIRQDKPYNEIKRGAIASLVTSMGRAAAHTGQIITYDDMLNSDHEFAPGIDRATMDSPAPVVLEADGKYPVPQPGKKGKREY